MIAEQVRQRNGNQDQYCSARILYMEDDIGLSRLLQKRLERMQYVVDIAPDGNQGLRMFAKGSYDLVVADYNMPEVNGLDILRDLNGIVPVIILTGQGDEKLAVEAMKLGAADYVVKDANGEYIKSLPSIIDRVIDRHRLITEREQARHKLQASEDSYRTVVENQTELICRFRPGNQLIFANAAFCGYFGIRQSEIAFQSLDTLLPHSAAQGLKEILKRLTQYNQVELYTHSVKTIDGQVHWLQWISRAIFDDGQELIEFQLVGRDITEIKRNVEALRESEARTRTLLNAIPDTILRINRNGDCLDVRPKESQASLFSPDCIGKNIAEFLSADVVDLMLEHLQKVFRLQSSQIFQFSLQQAGGVSYQEVRLVFVGRREALAIIRDITERSQLEQQLQYLSIHDSLTGLYNRAYFQEEMQRLKNGRTRPVGIVVCDVDALKLVNDNLGHASGDELLKAAARVIRQAFRDNDAVMRIGGDEFAVLLPKANQSVLDEACARLRQGVVKFNAGKPGLFLSLSIGAAVSNGPKADLDEVFKQADEAMYRDKSPKSGAVRDAMVKTILELLERKGLYIKEHADRVKSVLHDFGELLAFSSERMEKLDLFAEYHDIGKVALPERILSIRGWITTEDFALIKGHCEAGYKLAVAVPKLQPVADFILKHHEWWNGAGYPLGIRALEIPLECRMLAIVDAFESMTSGRYAEAKTTDEALNELRRCAGTQFDPQLVEAFLRLETDAWFSAAVG